MDELESKISAIFSSPEHMEQIKNLAQSLSSGGFGHSDLPHEQAMSAETKSLPAQSFDPRLMQLMSKVMSEYSKPSEASSLLHAIRPYLSSERISKLDRALNIAKLAKIAKTIIPEFGGDNRV